MSVSEAVAVDSPPATIIQPAFSELVRKEIRATWHGTYHWLWLVGAFLLEAVIVALYARRSMVFARCRAPRPARS